MQTQPYPAVETLGAPDPGAERRGVDPSGRTVRDAIAYVRVHMRESTEPPPRELGRARFLWGLAQPLLGMRIMLRDRTMLGDALFPVFTIAMVCVIAGYAASEGIAGSLSSMWTGIVAFFAAFIALAPVPPFLFARHYARMAARARGMLDLGPREPWLEPISVSLWKTIAQSIIIAIGVLPITLVLSLLLIGAPMALAVQGVWTLHWMVVEGLDNGRTLAPGETVEQVSRVEDELRHDPWYHRWLHHVTNKKVVTLLSPVRMLAEVVRALGRPWSFETRIVESDRALCMGFGLGVVALLAVPGLNLFFRPALVIGAAHLRGRLEGERAP
jgi:hypothetical protein